MDYEKTADEKTGEPENLPEEILQPAENGPEPAEEKAPPLTAVRENAELKKEFDELNGKFLRLAAEYENYRKRSAKEKADAYTDSYSDAVGAFLPLIDSVVRALEFTPGDKGINAIYKQIEDILEKLGVKEIESDDSPFDPNFHNAIAHEENKNLPENTVIQTFQKGYTLGERVLRHAMVKVVN